MSLLTEQLNETVRYIKGLYASRPEVGIVLGSGLGNLVKEMQVEKEIPYEDIPISRFQPWKGTMAS